MDLGKSIVVETTGYLKVLGASKGLNESSQNEGIICARNCFMLQKFRAVLSYYVP